MTHGISDQEWSDYLDGLASPELRRRIESHITACISCWEFNQRMSLVTMSLEEAGQEARELLTLEDRRLHHLMRGTFTRLRAEGGIPGRAQVEVRLNTLETVLAPFCGIQAAVQALQTAARESPARSLDRVSDVNWEPFLDRLTDIAATLCGDTFAILVRERGRL